MPALDSRITALERTEPKRSPRLILIRAVTPGHLDVYPSGTLPAPPYLPAVDRLPNEDWDAFAARLEGMISHLPAGKVVQVVSR